MDDVTQAEHAAQIAAGALVVYAWARLTATLILAYKREQMAQIVDAEFLPTEEAARHANLVDRMIGHTKTAHEAVESVIRVAYEEME